MFVLSSDMQIQKLYSFINFLFIWLAKFNGSVFSIKTTRDPFLNYAMSTLKDSSIGSVEYKINDIFHRYNEVIMNELY